MNKILFSKYKLLKYISVIYIFLVLAFCSSPEEKTSPKLTPPAKTNPETNINPNDCPGGWKGGDISNLPYKEKLLKEFEWREKLTGEQYYDMIQNIQQSLQELNSRPCSSYKNYYLTQTAAGIYMQKKDFNGAISIWKRYIHYFPHKEKDIKELITFLENSNETVTINNMGKSINSSYAEYVPVIELSGKKIYFTANEREGGKGKEDIWESEFDSSTGKWKKSKPVDKLNTLQSEAAIGISSDGTILAIFGNYPDSLGSGDLYFSQLTKNGWGDVQHFEPPISSEFFEADVFFSSDNQVMLFSSDRPGSDYPFHRYGDFYGGSSGNTDLYVVFKKNGKFTEIINLGNMINTPGEERTPYLHPDGKTIYFSSDGHNGFGGLDIFQSVRLDSTWKNWSKPINLGKQVNGSGMDWGLKLITNTNKGVFSGLLDDSVGESDLYEITIPSIAQTTSKMTALKGTLKDRGGNPVEADIEVTDAKGNTISNQRSKPNGEYYIVVEPEKKYNMIVKQEEKEIGRQPIETTKNEPEKEVKVELATTAKTTSSAPNLFVSKPRSVIETSDNKDDSKRNLNLEEYKSYINSLPKTCKLNTSFPDILIHHCGKSHISMNLAPGNNMDMYYFILLYEGDNYNYRKEAYQYFFKNSCPAMKSVHELSKKRMVENSHYGIDSEEREWIANLLRKMESCK